MPDATSSSSQMTPDTSAPPKKKRSIFKNVPSWSAKEIPSPSSPSKRSPQKVESSSKSNDSPKNQRSPLVQDDNFFNRSIETLRHYEEHASMPKQPETNSTANGEGLRTMDGSIAEQGDTELRNNSPPQKRRRLDEEPNDSEAPTSATLEQNQSDYDDVMDDIYSHPSEFRGASISKPVEIPEDNVNEEVHQSSPPKRKVAPITINLSDSEDEDNLSITKAKPLTTSTASDSPILPSIETEAAPNGHESAREAEQATSELTASNTKDQTTPPAKPLPPLTHDPVIAILVTSPIPHTLPLLANRRFSQRLKEVREAWCNRNQLPQASADAVYLQWRGKRIFDFSSCRALGMRINELGEVWINGRCQPAGPDGSQIQMEAVNKAIVDEMKERAQREQEAANESLEFGNSQPGADKGGELAAEADRGAKIRVLLRSKEFEVYKVVVKQVTLVERLLNAFIKAYQIPSEKTVSLFFDGEKLDPAQKLLDTDVQDRDFVDVYIK